MDEKVDFIKSFWHVDTNIFFIVFHAESDVS